MITAGTATSWEDYTWWQATDPDVVGKINNLIKDIIRDPFKGPGKPEPLGGKLAGWWSRRIMGEHRLVYKIEGSGPGQRLVIIQARFHYSSVSSS